RQAPINDRYGAEYATSAAGRTRPLQRRDRTSANACVAVVQPRFGQQCFGIADPNARGNLLAGREPDDGLEATPEHALAVEGHLRGVHRLLELRILHHRLVDAVALLLVPIHDPRQRDYLAVLEL